MSARDGLDEVFNTFRGRLNIGNCFVLMRSTNSIRQHQGSLIDMSMSVTYIMKCVKSLNLLIILLIRR